MGRAALDEEAIRLIEEHNPLVDFDWTRILKGQPPPDVKAAPVEQSQRQLRERREADRRRERSTPPQPIESDSAEAEQVLSPVASQTVQPDVQHHGAEDIPIGLRDSASPSVDSDEVDEIDVALAEGDPAIAESPYVEELARQLTRPAEEEPPTPAHRRLGFEGVSRLRARYAEVLARISERVTDPAKCERLKSEAERLNPDTWVTDDEVRQGLEQYEAVFESLRAVVGQPRRRRRRSRHSRNVTVTNQPAQAEGTTQIDGDEPEEEDR